MTFALVPLSIFHAEIVSHLHQEGFDEFWSEKNFIDLIKMPASYGFLACTDNLPVGFILCQGDDLESEIITIVSAQSQRRQGLATLLLAAVLERSKTLFLEVGVDNPNALSFYKKMGFTEVGRRKKYYERAQGVFVDALVMQKK